jgi:hypothetical protein
MTIPLVNVVWIHILRTVSFLVAIVNNELSKDEPSDSCTFVVAKITHISVYIYTHACPAILETSELVSLKILPSLQC